MAWVSLDAADNDLTRFWRFLVEALDRVRPGVAGPVSPLLADPRSASLEAVVTAVVNTLAAAGEEAAEEVALVLDDYHLIDSPAVHDSVALLLDRLSATLPCPGSSATSSGW